MRLSVYVYVLYIHMYINIDIYKREFINKISTAKVLYDQREVRVVVAQRL